jgi:hypothetical protein
MARVTQSPALPLYPAAPLPPSSYTKLAILISFVTSGEREEIIGGPITEVNRQADNSGDYLRRHSP